MQKPFAVRVLSDPPAVALHHTIHRADDARAIRKPIQVLDDGDLVGEGAVKAHVALRLQPTRGIRQQRRRHIHIDVAVVQTVVRICRLHDGHCGIVRGWLGEGTGERGEEVHGSLTGRQARRKARSSFPEVSQSHPLRLR